MKNFHRVAYENRKTNKNNSNDGKEEKNYSSRS